MDTNVFLETYANKCYKLRICHEMCYDHYTRLNRIINIVNISTVSFIAVSNNITTSTVATSEILGTMYSIGLYFTVMISSVQQFLQYEKLSERHRVGSVRYNNLYNAIMAYCVLEPDDRQPKGEFIKWLTQEFDTLYTHTPNIPTDIFRKFELNKKDTDVVFNKIKTETLALGKILGEKEKDSDDKSNKKSAGSFIGSSGASSVKIDDTVVVIDPPYDKAVYYQMQRFMSSSYEDKCGFK